MLKSSTEAATVRVCIVSKFPPIEGGIAARTYWNVRRLLDAGHDVALITNSGSVEQEYRIAGCDEHLDWLVHNAGLRLHDIPGPAPWHVPRSQDYLERLLNELLLVLRSGDWDQIQSDYLVPYGIAAHLASKLTGVPHIVRHGGSDIAKFLDHPAYCAILRDVLNDAQLVITDDHHEHAIRSIGARTERRPIYEVCESAFQAESGNGVRESGGVFAYIGKINHHWRRKGLDQIVDWYARQDRSKTTLRIVGQGVGESDFVRWASERLETALPVEPFVPPWDMPQLLASVDSVFALDSDTAVMNTSMLAIEARQMGIEVIKSL